MALISAVFYLLTLLSAIFPLFPNAQNISTDMPVPPLQWLNLSGLLNGPSPPPLKDAAIGYDDTSRSIIIFGGQSGGGFVQSQTYLLNLDTLTWSSPSPPSNLGRTPAARSAAVAGEDFAASYRHGFVVIGGKGTDGNGLSDVWEYDFNNQFWSEVNVFPGSGPLPRSGASGGIDISTPPVQDPMLSGPNNTLYLAGGSNDTWTYPLSDVWRLNISGTLSSNLPNDTFASWDRLTIGNLPARVGSAGTVISQQLVAVGGCNSTSSLDCTQAQDSYVINVQSQQEISPKPCAAPRTGPVLVANMNAFSTSFSSQVFLLLGTLNTSQWEDDNGLASGEVAVLDIDGGTWSRILPSGDPGASGAQKPTFPTPRMGAAAFSYPSGLVGLSRNASSDAIVFGGEDTAGNLLSEVWLLRAYSGVITTSGMTWSGYGNGQLQTGINADGSGVSVQYMSECASMVTSTSPSPSPSSNTSVPEPTTPSLSSYPYDTSIIHKVLAPVSLAVLQPVFLFFRLFPSDDGIGPLRHVVSALLLLAAYGLGIAGLITSFTTISAVGPSSGRSPDLKTGHGIAGLIFFVCLYGLVPGLFVIFLGFERRDKLVGRVRSQEHEVERAISPGSPEKVDSIVEFPIATPRSVGDTPPPSSPRARTSSWGLSSNLHEGGLSSDSESFNSAGPTRAFEVVNRPRPRRTSGNWLIPAGEYTPHQLESRNLGDIDWLQRRRSLNAVGELDYVISQARRARQTSTLATADALITSTTITTQPPLSLPSASKIAFRVLLQASLLGLCVITLIALWFRASRAAFAVFLAWTTAFYIAMFTFAWHLRPKTSILAIICSRLFHRQEAVTSPTPPPTLQPPGPYFHHPPYHATVASDDASVSHGAHRSSETDDHDDIDEDMRQRTIEDEMGRRDVSIVTIPKRKLWIANPS